MSEAIVKMSGESQQLLAALSAITKGFDAVTASIKKQEEDSTKANTKALEQTNKLESALAGQFNQLKNIALGWLSVQGAIGLATAEFDKYKQRMDSAASATHSFAAGVAAATRNAPAGFSGADIEQMSLAAAGQAGLSPGAVAGAMPAMFAAGGAGLNRQQYSQILTAAGPVAFGSVPEYQSTASVAASFMAQMPSLTAEQSIGFIQTAAGGSLVNKFDQYGPLAVSVAAAANAMGFDVPQSLALLNATTRGTGDVMGPSSRTATIQYMDALSRARTDLKLPAGATQKDVIDALRDPKNSAYRKRWETDIKAEVSHRAFMQSITGGGIGAGFVDQGFAATPTVAGAQAAYNSMAAGVMSAPSVRNAMVGQAIGGSAEGNYIAQGEAGVVREAMAKIRASSSGWAVEDWWDEKSLDAAIWQGRNPIDHTAGELRNRIKSLRTPGVSDAARAHGVYAPSGFGGGYLGEMQGAPPPRDRTREIEILEQLLAAILRMSRPPPAANGERPINPGLPLPTTGN